MTAEAKAQPKLRFRGFQDEWKSRTIQSLIDDGSIVGHLDGNHGELYPRSEEFSSEGVAYISANDFAEGLVDFSRCKRLPPERAAKFKKGIARSGDVLFAHNATVGPTAILSTSADYVILSTTATYYRCSPESLLNAFLRASLQADYFVRQYSRVMSQSTRNQVPITMQRRFHLKVPTPPEQRKIADFLTAVDERIQQLIQKKALLTDYKKGVMQQLFTQVIRFKDIHGNDFPDWKEKKLGEVCDVVMGQSPDSRSYNDEGNGLPLVQGNADIKKRKTRPRAWTSEPTKTCVSGDLILTVRAPVGYVAKSEHHACLGRGVASINSNSEAVQEFVYQWLLNYELRWGRLEQGSTFMAVSGTDIRGLSIVMPSVPEQTKIADFLFAIDRKIETIASQITETQTFKRGLLQQMFV